MEWWNKMVFPMRRAWIDLSSRFGFRKRGLLKLRRDVRSCEYEDVHVMWEMLNRTGEMDLLPRTSTATRRNRKRPFWKVFTTWTTSCREF